MSNLKENSLKELIRNSRKLQKVLDLSIEKALDELKDICKDKEAYQNAEEAVLLFIYEETDTNDKQITLDKLMDNIRNINKG